MKYIDRWFILMGIAYGCVSFALGIWMGVNQDFTHRHLHAHVNLVGWASMALFGLIYKSYPQLTGSRLARLQFWLSAIGTPVFMIGIPLAETETTILPAVVGSLMVLSSILVFLAIFARHASVTA